MAGETARAVSPHQGTVARDPLQNVSVRLSVLDRLLDDSPQNAREPPPSPHQALRQMVEAVRRDLQDLLNTRQSWIDDALLDREHVGRSIATFGLPDFSTEYVAGADGRDKLRRLIARTITTFEPRLVNVVVTPEPMQPHERHLRFRIDALLRVDPLREPVTFDTVLQSTGVAEVRAL